MTYKPTFQVTPKKRAWYQRLTPAAWLIIAVGGIVALSLLLGLFKTLFGERDVPLVLPATSTPIPTPSPTAPSSPTSTLRAEPQDEAVTPEAWVWWADQMTCDDQGHCSAPQQVADEIIAAFWEWKQAIPFYYYELDMTPEQLATYYTGEILDLQLEFLSLVQGTGAMWEGETILKEYDYEVRLPHVASCSPDGLTCMAGETVQGDLTIHEYDLTTRQIVNSVQNPPDQHGGLNIWQFKYDLEDSRWKVERYSEWVPAPAP